MPRCTYLDLWGLRYKCHQKLSKEVLALIMEKGSSKSLIEARGLMHRKVAPLSLDVSDIGDCITYCMLKDMIDEAFKWYLVMEDSFHLQPTDSIVALVLSALAKAPSWERLFYVLNEAQRLQVPISLRVRYSLLQACHEASAVRWRYVASFLVDIEPSPVEMENREREKKHMTEIVQIAPRWLSV